MRILPPHEILKTYRQFLGYTQAELAKQMQTTPTSVSRWESALSPIDSRTLAHVGALVRERLMQIMNRDFAKIAPELTLADFEIYGIPTEVILEDHRGRRYVGTAEIIGTRKYSLHYSVDNKSWFAFWRGGIRRITPWFLEKIREEILKSTEQ